MRELVAEVRGTLEREFGSVLVEGEISNFHSAGSGHLYFTLKDAEAQLRVAMFRNHARLLRFRPEDGMQVMVRGKLTVYESRGEMQLAAEYLEPKGAGALLVAFEQLKAKLSAEGLFDPARKRPIPQMPRRIGVVTSPRGAAVQDILNVLRRRHEGVHVLIWPAQVQGESAPAEVSAGIKYFNSVARDAVDVILVARGGGSAEDLAAFNDEGLARVIAASKIPTISAVGHEVDFTIADFVADLRAPTPSAAAELVIESKHAIAERVGNLRHRLEKATRYHLALRKQHFTELAQHGAFAGMRDLLNRRQQRWDDLRFRLETSCRERLQVRRQRYDVADTRLRSRDLRLLLEERRLIFERSVARLREVAQAQWMRRRARWDQAEARLTALSPLKILDRGYALVLDASGNLVKDAAKVASGEEITARVARGQIRAVVK